MNAGFCFLDNTIGWDRGELLPELRDNFGDIAVTNVLAHEYGHAIQRQAKLNKKDTPTLVAEQQADCFAGAYMRWVAEGNSPRFTLSTGDGLNKLLAAMISFRDPLLSEDEYRPGANEHGSAFERITASSSASPTARRRARRSTTRRSRSAAAICRSSCNGIRPANGRSARSR